MQNHAYSLTVIVFGEAFNCHCASEVKTVWRYRNSIIIISSSSSTVDNQCYFSYGFSVSVTVIVFQFLFLFQLVILHKICISA